MDPQQLAPALAQLRLGDSCLRPAHSTAFKREERRQRKERRRQRKLQQLLAPPLVRPRPLDNPTASDIPWPCEPAPLQPTSGWSHPWPATAAPPSPPPPEDEARAAAALAQQNALQASLAFLSRNAGSDDEDSTDEDGALAFFVDLFEKDRGLRDYYKTNRERGEFRCLVCGSGSKQAWRRFVNCAALVHHSITISRTKRRQAHREFARAVRQLLGWDAQGDLLVHTEEQFDEEVDLDIGIESCIVNSMEYVEEEGVVRQ